MRSRVSVIWFAEYLGIFARASTYPDQDAVWRMVSLQKLGSGHLLMLVSVALVPSSGRPTARSEAGQPA